MLTAALVVGALVAGLAGTWSPCGLSMICTLAPRARSRRAVAAALVALSAGCVAGGVRGFSALAVTGRAVVGGGIGAAIVAGALALLAAALDARGARVVPQIRSQVPEPWRRRAPLAAAAGGYGVLLGLGFTTFVMSYTLWAVAALSLLVAGPVVGVAAGIGFGLGRSLPIVVLAPATERPWAQRAQDAMMQRPRVLRAVRCAGAALLALAGAVLLVAPAQAARPRVVAHGVGPSVDGTRLAFHRGGTDDAFVRRLDGRLISPFTGQAVAVGGGWLAVVDQTTLSLTPLTQPGVAPEQLAVPPGIDAVAVDERWIAYLVPATTTTPIDQLFVARRDGSQPSTIVGRVRAPSELGPPSLSGDRIAFGVMTRAGARIDIVDLHSGRFTHLERRDEQLIFPSLDGDAVAYVEVDACRQRLVVQSGHRRRVLLSRFTRVRRDTGFDPGVIRVGRIYHCAGPRHAAAGNDMFWETALGAHAAYLTIVDAVAPAKPPIIVAVRR